MQNYSLIAKYRSACARWPGCTCAEHDLCLPNDAAATAISRAQYPVNPRWAVAVEDYADFGMAVRWSSLDAQQHVLFAIGDYKGEGFSVEGGVGMGLTHASDGLTFKLVISRELPHSK